MDFQYFKKHKQVLQNFSYVTMLQIFSLLAPLITYPYLVRVLGRELYGVVLTAQMLASYVSIFVDFGSNDVCAKHVSINRDDNIKLSEILSSVLFARFGIWIVCFFIYFIIVSVVPSYREHFILFLLTYFLSIQEFLFPQFFFQGFEKMKFTTYITIGIRLFFICLVFIVVRDPSDVLFVPILYSIGYLLGGIASLYIIHYRLNVHISKPSFKQMLYYVKDSSAIFATNLICTIKDKLNYLLVGTCVGMSDVVIYDLGVKINGFIEKPAGIIRVVLFPRIAKTRSLRNLKLSIIFTLGIVTTLVLLVNLFLPWIVQFFIGSNEIDLLPLRLFSFAPILASISVMIAINYFVAFGHNKYVLFSIIITTVVYVLVLMAFLLFGRLNSIYSFIIIALISYFAEFLYRIYVFNKMSKNSEISSKL